MDLSNACTIDPTVDRESLICALCGGARDAMDESCESRKGGKTAITAREPFLPYRAVEAKHRRSVSAM